MKRHVDQTVMRHRLQRLQVGVQKLCLVSAGHGGKPQTHMFGKTARRAAIEELLEIGIVATQRPRRLFQRQTSGINSVAYRATRRIQPVAGPAVASHLRFAFM